MGVFLVPTQDHGATPNRKRRGRPFKILSSLVSWQCHEIPGLRPILQMRKQAQNGGVPRLQPT